MNIYRYTINYYTVPEGYLKDKTMIDVQRNYESKIKRIISTQNSDMNKVIVKNLPEAPEGFENLLGYKNKITPLDAFDKNLEFCHKAELQNPKIKEYADIWEYLEWCMGETMLAEEVKETLEAIKNKDETELLDGACDIAVIALNLPFKLFSFLGYDEIEAMSRTKEAFNRVVDSNLSKLKNDEGFKAEFREDGKVLKGGAFQKPMFNDLLND